MSIGFYCLFSFNFFLSISSQNLSEIFTFLFLYKKIEIQTEFKFKKTIIQIFSSNQMKSILATQDFQKPFIDVFKNFNVFNSSNEAKKGNVQDIQVKKYF